MVGYSEREPFQERIDLRKQLHKTIKNTYERMFKGDISIIPVDFRTRTGFVIV